MTRTYTEVSRTHLFECSNVVCICVVMCLCVCSCCFCWSAGPTFCHFVKLWFIYVCCCVSLFVFLFCFWSAGPAIARRATGPAVDVLAI